MDVALTVLFLGILIFLGNLFNRVFAHIRIPDLLFLIGIGLIIGSVLGLVSPASFGIVGLIFTTVKLAIILFEGGLHLRVDTIRSSLRETVVLTTVSFIATMVLETAVVYSRWFSHVPSRSDARSHHRRYFIHTNICGSLESLNVWYKKLPVVE